MTTLAIIGTGFTGSSMALALKEHGSFDTIVGFDTSGHRLEQALRLKAIDSRAKDVQAAVEGAAAVVVTVPSARLATVFEQIGPALASGALVTDTSMWKVQAGQAAKVLPPTVYYIGGRPVIDSAEGGPEAASAAVLDGALYCLTPDPDTAETAINTASSLVGIMGSQPYFMGPDEHDALTTATEVLPGLVLHALLRALTTDPAWLDAGRLASVKLDTIAKLAHDLLEDSPLGADPTHISRWLEACSDQLRAPLQVERGKDRRPWTATFEALGHWKLNRRQLDEIAIPPSAQLKPNLFGALPRLLKRGKD